MGKSLGIIPNNLFNLILISHTWIINLLPPYSPSLPLSLSPLSEKDWEVTPLSPYSPSPSLPSSLPLSHTLTPSASWTWAGCFHCLSERLWAVLTYVLHLCSSASFLFSCHQSHTSLHTSLSSPPPNLQDRKRSGSGEHQRRRLTTITGRGSGQWPVWGRTAVGQLRFNTFWPLDEEKPHQRRRRGKKSKSELKPVGLLRKNLHNLRRENRVIKTFYNK